MTAYYNEHDHFAAAWLRELIKAGHIAPGIVDERSIEDVLPIELAGFTQCHFFAGIGVWSYALRRAGWPDDRPVWTGSCPCQPFSAAGKGAGFVDERHLWPSFYHLIAQCKPSVVFGEQVASKAVDDWIDLVHADMEAVGYAFGSVPFPSAGVGAPHIRDRNFWVADADGMRRSPVLGQGAGRLDCGKNDERAFAGFGPEQQAVRMDNGESLGRAIQYPSNVRPPNAQINPLADRSDCDAYQQQRLTAEHPCPTNGFWSDADWLFCRDGKWRPVEPGTFPLVNGAAARVGRLRGYGNAINAEAAKAFIESFLAI